jgi:hypothetical protein
MSWALPLPPPLRRKVWEFKTQHPLAHVNAEVPNIFKQGGYVLIPCQTCLYRPRKIRFGRVRRPHCAVCDRENYILNLVDFPCPVDVALAAYDELGGLAANLPDIWRRALQLYDEARENK